MPSCSRCRKRYAADTMFTADETTVSLPDGGPLCLPCYDYLAQHGRHQTQRKRGAATTNARKGAEAESSGESN